MSLILTGVKDFVQSLTNGIEKRDVLEQVRETYKELTTIVKPMYDLDIRFKNTSNAVDKEVLPVFRKAGLRGDNAIKIVQGVLEDIVKNESDVIEMVQKNYGEVVVKDALDYKAISIQYYIESLWFVTDYARLLIQAYVAQELDGEGLNTNTPMDRANFKEVVNYDACQAFTRFAITLSKPVDKFLKELEKLDGVIYDPVSHEQLNSRVNTDPMGYGFIPVRWCPWYHAGLLWNTWQNARREKAREEFDRLQIMVLSLKDRAQYETDPEARKAANRALDYHSNRMNRLAAKIERMES